jgi:hypothetical protein
VIQNKGIQMGWKFGGILVAKKSKENGEVYCKMNFVKTKFANIVLKIKH